jgi:hypothetical protein
MGVWGRFAQRKNSLLMTSIFNCLKDKEIEKEPEKVKRISKKQELRNEELAKLLEIKAPNVKEKRAGLTIIHNERESHESIMCTFKVIGGLLEKTHTFAPTAESAPSVTAQSTSNCTICFMIPVNLDMRTILI